MVGKILAGLAVTGLALNVSCIIRISPINSFSKNSEGDMWEYLSNNPLLNTLNSLEGALNVPPLDDSSIPKPTLFYLAQDPFSNDGWECFKVIDENLDGIMGTYNDESAKFDLGFKVAPGNRTERFENLDECFNPLGEFKYKKTPEGKVIRSTYINTL